MERAENFTLKYAVMLRIRRTYKDHFEEKLTTHLSLLWEAGQPEIFWQKVTEIKGDRLMVAVTSIPGCNFKAISSQTRVFPIGTPNFSVQR